MGATFKDLELWIGEAMKKKNIKNYQLDISGSSSKGDGYLGEISFVKVVVVEKVYDMVVKSAKDNDELREKSPIAETYQREIFMYAEVFPILEQFQKDNTIENPFKSIAKCYSTSNIDKKEALVLSNLKSEGYIIHNRMKPQNFEHILFVFQTYAKFHGLSLAFKLNNPEKFKKITENMSDIMGLFLTKTGMTPVLRKSFEKGIDLLKENGKFDDAKKMERFDVMEMLTKLTMENDKDAEKEAVILHGDCWNNNMMFKYKENDFSRPTDMVFIDFQISRVASPILDLSYYLYAVADDTTLNKLDFLLEEYHKTLKSYLKQYSIDINDHFPLQKLKESWKKFGKFGLGMCPFIMRVELCEEDEVIDFTGAIGKGKMEEMKIGDIRDQKEYDRRVFNVFKHFADKFL